MGFSKCPRIPACKSKGDCPSCRHLPEAGVLEEFESGGEMFLHPRELAAVVTHHHLERTDTTEKAARTSFASSEFEGLVGKVAGGGQVTRRESVHAHSEHQI